MNAGMMGDGIGPLGPLEHALRHTMHHHVGLCVGAPFLVSHFGIVVQIAV